MALMGDAGLLSFAPRCVVLIAEGLLLSFLIAGGSSTVAKLVCRECFFASWSITAAYSLSMSSCARCLSASNTFGSKDMGLWTTGLTGVLPERESPPPLFSFRTQLVAERMEPGLIGVSMTFLTGFNSCSNSSAVGGSNAFLLIFLPIVRRRTPQIKTVKT